MARDHLGVLGHVGEYPLEVLQVALDRSAAVHVDERKMPREQEVSHMDDIGIREEHDAVAVGVAGGQMDELDVFAVEVHVDAVFEGDDRPAGGVHRVDGLIAALRWHHEALAHVLLRDDSAFLAEHGITPDVVAVVVRVQDELERARIECRQRRANLVGQALELVVDDENAVRSDARADVAALAFEHVDVARDLCGLDLDVGWGRRLRERDARREQRTDSRTQEHVSHVETSQCGQR